MSASERLRALEAQRAHACRLTPDRALESLDEADEFLRDRGMLTLMPSSALPSLFGACHEEPYMPGKPGFAQWPKTKYPWAFELRARTGVVVLKLVRGKELYLTPEPMAGAAPLCRAELRRADDGEYGDDARRLVAHLESAGPSALDELKEELGLDSRALRVIRTPLERVGALVSRGLTVATAEGGHRHTSELVRFDQLYDGPEREDGLAGLLVAGVDAAVLTPEQEARRWFSWAIESEVVDRLLDAELVTRPAPGWLATRASSS